MTPVAACIAELDRVFRRGDATKSDGYRVLEKWLKDRKGRRLGMDDIAHYRKIALALATTRTLMAQIDAAAGPLFPDAVAAEELIA